MAICLHVLFPSSEHLHHAVIISSVYGSDFTVHLIKIEEMVCTIFLVFPGGTQDFRLRADKLT